MTEKCLICNVEVKVLNPIGGSETYECIRCGTFKISPAVLEDERLMGGFREAFENAKKRDPKNPVITTEDFLDESGQLLLKPRTSKKAGEIHRC